MEAAKTLPLRTHVMEAAKTLPLTIYHKVNNLAIIRLHFIYLNFNLRKVFITVQLSYPSLFYIFQGLVLVLELKNGIEILTLITVMIFEYHSVQYVSYEKLINMNYEFFDVCFDLFCMFFFFIKYFILKSTEERSKELVRVFICILLSCSTIRPPFQHYNLILPQLVPQS